MSPTVERAIGRLLRPLRAGEQYLACNSPHVCNAPNSIRLTSPAFADGSAIPSRYAGSGVGQNISPPLAWTEVPSNTVEIALVMQDPDAPLLQPVVHLVAVGLAPRARGVNEGALSAPADRAISLGRGSFGRVGYAGPRPVRGHGPHRYVFQIFALKRRLATKKEPRLGSVMAALSDSVVARGSLVGTYERA